MSSSSFHLSCQSSHTPLLRSIFTKETSWYSAFSFFVLSSLVIERHGRNLCCLYDCIASNVDCIGTSMILEGSHSICHVIRRCPFRKPLRSRAKLLSRPMLLCRKKQFFIIGESCLLPLCEQDALPVGKPSISSNIDA